MRREFNNDYFYHIYNRGNDKRDIFLDESDYIRFLKSIREFNCIERTWSLRELEIRRKRVSSTPSAGGPALGVLETEKLVTIYAYCLNPNHFHLLLKQHFDGGISKFSQKAFGGYTNFFNVKYKRSGSLFQGSYKCAEIKSIDKLIYISAYINGNAEIHKISKAVKWPWSSYLDYMNKRNGTLCDKILVLDEFKNMEEYKSYTNDVINDNIELKKAYKEARLEEEEKNDKIYKNTPKI